MIKILCLQIDLFISHLVIFERHDRILSCLDCWKKNFLIQILKILIAILCPPSARTDVLIL